MSYLLNDPKVFQAIDLVVKDVDKKYDECLVEKFLDYIRHSVSLDATKKELLNRIQQYMVHKSFIMMNQTRAVKILSTTLNGQFDQIYLTNLWNIVDTLVINDNLAAMTVVFNLFKATINTNQDKDEESTWWLLNQKFTPPIKLKGRGEIDNLISLSKELIENCVNYHTKNQAISQFDTLVQNVFFRFSQSSRLQQYKKPLEQSLEQLIVSVPDSMSSVVANISSQLGDDKPVYQELRQQLASVVWKVYGLQGKRPRSHLISICKCLSSLDSESEYKFTVDKLIESNDLESVILYLSYYGFRVLKHPEFMNYLIYPLLTKCKDHSRIKEQLSEQKFSHLEFVKKNTTDKMVGTCITGLENIFCSPDLLSFAKTEPTDEILRLVAQVLFLYVEDNHDCPNRYRNIMSCCKVLYSIKKSHKTPDQALVREELSRLDHLIETIELTAQNKPILIELLKLSLFLREILLKTRSDGDRLFMSKTIDLAFKLTDPDLLIEYAEFFVRNECEFDKEEKYVELIWEHIYPIAAECEHRDLVVTLANLLIKRDNIRNIEKCHEIQEGLREILLEIKNDEFTFDEGDEPQLSSVVDDIINSELLPSCIQDCY